MIIYAILRYKCLFIHEGVLTLTDSMNLVGYMFYISVYLTTLCELLDFYHCVAGYQGRMWREGSNRCLYLSQRVAENRGNHKWYVPFPGRVLNLGSSHVKRSYQSLCWGFRCEASKCKFTFYERLGIKYWTSTFILSYSVKLCVRKDDTVHYPQWSQENKRTVWGRKRAFWYINNEAGKVILNTLFITFIPLCVDKALQQRLPESRQSLS
jgi:hypothetical protein